MSNPFMQPWDGAFGLPPFQDISDDHFAPAFDLAMAEAEKNIAAISTNPQPPSFANTIDALEQAEQQLERLLGVFFNLASADSTPKRQELQRVFAPKLAEYSSKIAMDQGVFGRIEALWDERDTLGLSDEQLRVLMLSRRAMVRAGAALPPDARTRLAEVMKELAALCTQFTQNLLADEASWSMELAETDLDGLPDYLISDLAAAAKDAGGQGYRLTVSRPLMTGFLQFSTRRDLRERAFAAWEGRGMLDPERDNRDLARQILALRSERATLLGYDDFATFKLETEMAGAPDAVSKLLTDVWAPAVAAANRDADRLQQMLRADGVNGHLEKWDWRHYSERRRAQEHDLNEAELKPYFQLERMIEAAFACATRLFGLAFRPLDVPLYHPDARAWEVTRNGAHVAVFIGDYFARGSKRSGAWCSAMRSQQKLGGEVAPIVVNICNFAKPAEGKPALLSFDDARTLFHEFGHALHQMLSDVTYPSVSGTSVARDFVELPSQLYEHWLEEPDVLAEFATHADTGEPMPADLQARLLAASSYDTGFATVEFLSSALVDLAFHRGKPPADPMARQAEILDGLGMPPAIAMRHATPQFSHIFSSDGYSAGYYSYMWSEVMDADAYAAFEEAGDPFDPALAKSLEDSILSRGGSVAPEVLYKAFRGRMPDIGPLLKGRGLAG